ncbi:MAG: inositol monophosphatase [Candidatus Diapherotrites archaeon]|nr:inositol monophosphatase [Candidatus Diapherotrites archaeon]
MTYTTEMKTALKAAKEAGKIVKNFFGNAVSRMKTEKEIVTEADLEAEKKIMSVIKKDFPHAVFCAEEFSSKHDDFSGKVWVVDPIDGTHNFSRGFEHHCICVALVEAYRPVLGVVLAPQLGKVFTAEKGKGAFLNSKKIFVSEISRMGDAFARTGFPGRRYGKPLQNTENFRRFNSEVASLHVLGSAALDICSVGEGKSEFFWCFGLKPWDICAAAVIVREAGGKVLNEKGLEWKPGDSFVFASNGKVTEAFYKKFDLKG